MARKDNPFSVGSAVVANAGGSFKRIIESGGALILDTAKEKFHAMRLELAKCAFESMLGAATTAQSADFCNRP